MISFSTVCRGVSNVLQIEMNFGENSTRLLAFFVCGGLSGSVS